MQTSEQTNTSLAEIADKLRVFKSFALCGHVGPDGDSLGSQLALSAALTSMGKEVTCLLARKDEMDGSLSFLEGYDGLVLANEFDGDVECFIAVDVPTRERLADATDVLDRAGYSIVIDHHAVPTTMADLTFTVPSAASTSVLIWKLIAELGVNPTAAMAECAYTGLMTDTGRFQYQNADSVAFACAAEMVACGAKPDVIAKHIYQNRRLASVRLESLATARMQLLADGQVALTWLSRSDFESCGATKADGEPIIDVLRSLQGVRVACVLREQGDEIRGSLRAKDDSDVASIARSYGGGGHKAAAGFSLQVPLEEAVEALRGELVSFVGR